MLFFVVFVLGAGIYGLFQFQQEKHNAFLMQTMLINTAIAQEAYYDAKGTFAVNWQEILPHIAHPSSSQVLWTSAEQPDMYYIGFEKEKQYELSVFMTREDLLIRARRIGIGYHYELQYRVPQGQTQCISTGVMKAFCDYLLKKFDELDAKNLVALPTKEKQTGNK